MDPLDRSAATTQELVVPVESPLLESTVHPQESVVFLLSSGIGQRNLYWLYHKAQRLSHPVGGILLQVN